MSALVQVRRAVVLAAALLVAALGVLAPAPAYAGTGDQIESFAITYDIAPNGTVRVSEKIELSFGSARHGFDRTFVTREKWTDKEDARYTISDIGVTSPTGAATQWQTKSASDGSDAAMTIRVGSPDRYADPRETYVLTYTVTGAMRPFASHDEFAWDATGFEWTMPIRNVTVAVTGPQPPTESVCFAGPVRSTDPCTSRQVTGYTARFTQASLPVRQGLTVAVKLPKGAVTNPNPDLVPNEATHHQRQLVTTGAVTGVTALLAPLLGWLHWRRRGRDDRYVGLAPGTVPPPGRDAPVRPSPKLTIPVAFSPPRIPVGEAGILIDGAVDVRDTTATLIDLAVRGALRIQDTSDSQYAVTLLDPSVAAAPHETVLLTSLFGGAGSGATVELGSRGTLTAAHDRVAQSLRAQVTARRWFHRVPGGDSGARIGGGSLITVAAMLFMFFPQLGASLLGGLAGGLSRVVWVAPLIPIVLTLLVLRANMGRGRRTADGRAVTDQVEGFRTYLATAEAHQLQFEEGEDIFSKYLPWAIMFDLAERWAQLCAELVAAGRIPQYEPSWYAGHYHGFNVIHINDGLTRSTMPEPPAPSVGSSGSGFGGGSSFGGGGFSGSGGGGGGGSTW